MAAGLRVSELAGMPLGGGARARTSFILVTGKGNKERLSPLSPAARAALDAYLEVRDEFRAQARQEQPLSVLPRAARKAFSPAGAFTSC